MMPLEKQDKRKKGRFEKGASDLRSVTSGHPISKG